MDLDTFFNALWQQYVDITPQAARIHGALQQRGEQVLNDHVAFRTFNRSPMRLAELEPQLLALGYRPLEPYHFANKHLDAWGYLPPEEHQPKVFLSELDVDALPKDCQSIVDDLVAQVPEGFSTREDAFFCGLPWTMPTGADYQRLAAVSEYAAWLSVMGMRANHFTIAVHKLNGFDQLEQMNTFVKEQVGLPLNTAGGEVKGSAEVYLKQSSTIADSRELTFSDGETLTVPTCFYEFAERFPQPDGTLYPGFVAASADRIFESTDRQSAN